ncbi:MAG: AAA family ATPase [Galactobacillus timonensis]|uniref:ATP-binding protein n=1 Tax=Galactobacillus timonensis TaxID=2041840 RepID=UPI002409E10F|nr:AAA family ATPase [Galactobacillus timonensis]MDD6600060.1 AAA family ATPase [Galactobacillus timonensis]
MIIQRKRYVEKLINKQWNGRIKILTGIRRCGKSTILFDLFLQYLLSQNVNREDIITLALDDDQNEQFRDPGKLSENVRAKCSDPRKKYYVFLGEIQFAISKEELRNPDQPVRLYSVLNGFLHMKNIDVYVTGSNSKLLSKDVLTEFRGRGDVIHIFPLSFAEYYAASGRDKMDAYDEFAMHGGMPYLLNLQTDEDKYDYLDNLFEEIYFKDIEERYAIQLPGVLRDLTSSLCSSIGSLTNASKIARTVNSSRSSKTDSETIS